MGLTTGGPPWATSLTAPWWEDLTRTTTTTTARTTMSPTRWPLTTTLASTELSPLCPRCRELVLCQPPTTNAHATDQILIKLVICCLKKKKKKKKKVLALYHC